MLNSKSQIPIPNIKITKFRFGIVILVLYIVCNLCIVICNLGNL